MAEYRWYMRRLFVDIFKQSSDIENGRNASFVIVFLYSQLFKSTSLPFIRYHNNTVPTFSLKSSLKYTNYHFFKNLVNLIALTKTHGGCYFACSTDCHNFLMKITEPGAISRYNLLFRL